MYCPPLLGSSPRSVHWIIKDRHLGNAFFDASASAFLMPDFFPVADPPMAPSQARSLMQSTIAPTPGTMSIIARFSKPTANLFRSSICRVATVFDEKIENTVHALIFHGYC
jgi:hypothetical protein